ncbi:small nuclear ribonucleoprotein F [Enteropsectra breve]|nr:small nuclear ribonucleoprotein F [Enteropsectra breve]
MEPKTKKERPMEFIAGLLNCHIKVELKWGQKYIGKLTSFDDYLNIVLADACEESEEGKVNLGEIIIRCNNIKTIQKSKS